MLIWFGFFFSLGILLLIARKNLWLGLVVASYLLGSFSMSLTAMWDQTIRTLSDPAIILLAISVGLIPVIGGAMERSGLMDDLVNNLHISKKLFLALTPTLVGLLPMPGGALLSAPLVDRSGKTVPAEKKTAINVWYRHVFLLIYPLGALLVTTSMAKLNLYAVMLCLIPGFLLMQWLGYWFLLRKITGHNNFNSRINLNQLMAPIVIILIAPLLHFSLMRIFTSWLPEIPLLIGVSTSLALAFWFGHLGLKDLQPIARKMKPWNFALIIVGMFLFLHIFQASETSRAIAAASFSKIFLLVGIGALLGFATGRVQVPVSILLPIYFAQFGSEAMTPFIFAVMFFAIYQGYVISPVHPCVSVSLEYFKTDLKSFYRLLAIPGLISVGLAWLLATIGF